MSKYILSRKFHFSLFHEPSKTKCNKRYSNIRCTPFRRKFLKLLHLNHWTFWLILQHCNMFSKLSVKYSQRPCMRCVLLFTLLLIYDEIQIAFVRKDGIICESNFIILNFQNLLNWYPFCLGMKTLL